MFLTSTLFSKPDESKQLIIQKKKHKNWTPRKYILVLISIIIIIAIFNELSSVTIGNAIDIFKPTANFNIPPKLIRNNTAIATEPIGNTTSSILTNSVNTTLDTITNSVNITLDTITNVARENLNLTYAERKNITNQTISKFIPFAKRFRRDVDADANANE